MSYTKFFEHSIKNPQSFWSKEAERIEWKQFPKQCLEYSKPPFAKWFVDGTTNLCHNAVDRHAQSHPHRNALIWVSSEAGKEQVYSFADLLQEVEIMASIFKELGVGKGDRVLIYMPMIPEAVFAMLACTRIGAIHSVVFGGFAAHSLASRIDDATPKLIVSADAGLRSGKVLPYKGLLDEAIEQSSFKPNHVLMVNRALADVPMQQGRDIDYTTLRGKHFGAKVDCEWLTSVHPSYILYTSGTTGKPKGVQRDTGGYAVAMTSSIAHIFQSKAGETFFSTSDIGWVVGHSYIVYAPLLAGMATILYEGTPIYPDAGVIWRLVEKYQVTALFSAPTAIRVLKKYDSSFIQQYKLNSLRALFLAGEPLDQATSTWIAEQLKKPIIDNYWQTETGWPILTIANGVEKRESKLGSPGIPMYGFNVKLLDSDSGQEVGNNQKGVVAVEGPLPPGCLQTVWRDDERFVKAYWNSIPGKLVYSTFDWGIRDDDGYFFILGRTDDVINIAGHRLGTREIEESIGMHQAVAEVAVVGVSDELKGQVAVGFVVLKDPSRYALDADQATLRSEIFKTVDQQLGAIGRPAQVHCVASLPKTRSGKLLRRAIQAICEGRPTGDLATIEDATALEIIKTAVAKK